MQDLNDNLPQFEDIVRRRMKRDVENDNKKTSKENTLQMRCSIYMHVETRGNIGYVFPPYPPIIVQISIIILLTPPPLSPMHVLIIDDYMHRTLVEYTTSLSIL